MHVLEVDGDEIVLERNGEPQPVDDTLAKHLLRKNAGEFEEVGKPKSVEKPAEKPTFPKSDALRAGPPPTSSS
jgi:hypothetical protein